MQRKYKFRVWDKDENRMVPLGNAIGDERVGYFLESNELQSQYDSVILMQFTGLVDRNGKDIYDGDICIAGWRWEEPHQIVWPDDYYDFIELALIGDPRCENVEVIGNVYQDPHLLKQEG